MSCRCREIPICQSDKTNLGTGLDYARQCQNAARDVPSAVEQAKALIEIGLYAENLSSTCHNLSKIAEIVEVDLISAVSEAGSGLSEAESLYEQFTAEDEEFHRMEEEKKKKKSSSKDKGSSVADK